MTHVIDGGGRLRAAVSSDDDQVVVTLTGEIDVASGPPLAELLGAALDCGVGRLQVWLAQVGFVDVYGLRVLRQVHRQGADRGIMVTLHEPQPHIRWLIEVAGAAPLLADHAAQSAPDPQIGVPDDVRTQREHEQQFRHRDG
ncbi:STAS domain-containing protein [Actinoplanes sp. NPDC051859]|uniref:STAS domain-containing protein n=1 Tax=Actinoplanes sp. NPDC051859 TaxID=3363909 RepID=UPI0037BCF17D